MERAGRVIGKLAISRRDLTPEQLATSAWSVAVGKRLSQRTKPIGLVRDRLIVEVEDAVWQRQLFTLRSQILKQMEAALGDKLVGDLEFRIAVPKREPARATAAQVGDEAEGIRDSYMRSIYKTSRKRASA